MSAEQQAQLNQFPDSRGRDRGRNNNNNNYNNNRGRGWAQQRGGFRGGRQDNRDRSDNRLGGGGGGGSMRANRGRLPHPSFAQPFPHNQMRSPGRPMPLMGQGMGRLPYPRDQSPGLQFVGRAAVGGPMGPQPLMRMPQGQGNRLLLPGQESGFNMGPPPLPQQQQQVVGGMVPLLPGQMPSGHPLQQRSPQSTQSQHLHFR